MQPHLRIALWSGAAMAVSSSPASAGIEQLLSLCLAGADVLRPEQLSTAWSLAPQVAVPVALLGFSYAIASCYRTRSGGASSASQRAAFWLGFATLLLALVSPLCRLAATMASAHMVQHVFLVAVAPPLLVLGWPRRGFGPAGPLWIRTALYGAAIWFWHVPASYEAALLSVPIHLAMYTSLLATGALFWHGILAASRAPERCGTAVLVLLGTLVHTGMLGALLTFSPAIWFPIMEPGALAWGLAPLADQQLAGLIMWVPMGAIYLLAAVTLIGRALSNLGNQSVAAPPRVSPHSRWPAV